MVMLLDRTDVRLLDLITVEENGQQVTMYDKLVTQTKARLDRKTRTAGSESA